METLNTMFFVGMLMAIPPWGMLFRGGFGLIVQIIGLLLLIAGTIIRVVL